jgi:hypothetical protein
MTNQESRAERIVRIKYSNAATANPKARMDVTFVTATRSQNMLALAYAKLEESEALKDYFPRFRHHHPRQLVTMAGRFDISAPWFVMQGIIKDLTKGVPVWQAIVSSEEV